MRKRLMKSVFYAATKLLGTDELKPTEELISGLLASPKNQQNQARISLERFYRFCAAKFPNSLSLKLLRVYASTEPRYHENVRESAIRRLSVLLSDHRVGGEPLLTFSAIQELAPLLVSCLEEQEIPEDTFKILAQVAYHVAFEIFNCHDAVWSSLSKYISARAETEFKKAVYIFQSLSIPLQDEEFVIPLIENLVPPILKWLDPLNLHKENNWVASFAGAFCAAIHLLGTRRADLVENIVYKMLSSVSELVNRGMEVGVVRRALRDVEMLVRKQSNWYCTKEYKFVSGLIRRMNAVKGMKNGTKTVLWRIQMVMEKNTTKSIKERDNGVDEDWLNQ